MNTRLRSRIIDPGFFQNEELCSLPFAVRLLLAGLWVAADREGRLEDRPRRLRGLLFAYDPELDLDAMLGQLESSGFIIRYSAEEPVDENAMESARGNLGSTQVPPRANLGSTQVNPGLNRVRRYIQITGFPNYQKPHPKEALSRIPAPQLDGGSRKCNRMSEGQPGLNLGGTQVEPRLNLGSTKARGLRFMVLEEELLANARSSSSEASTEPEKGSGSVPAALLVEWIDGFPVVGKNAPPDKTWRLPMALYEELVASFPGVDVRAEILAARMWTIANKSQRKTPSGMPRFLASWMTREQNRGGRGAAKGGNGSSLLFETASSEREDEILRSKTRKPQPEVTGEN